MKELDTLKNFLWVCAYHIISWEHEPDIPLVRYFYIDRWHRTVSAQNKHCSVEVLCLHHLASGIIFPSIVSRRGFELWYGLSAEQVQNFHLQYVFNVFWNVFQITWQKTTPYKRNFVNLSNSGLRIQEKPFYLKSGHVSPLIQPILLNIISSNCLL